MRTFARAGKVHTLAWFGRFLVVFYAGAHAKLTRPEQCALYFALRILLAFSQSSTRPSEKIAFQLAIDTVANDHAT